MKSTIFYGRNNEPVLRLSRRYPLLFWQVQVVASVAKVAGLPYMVTQDVIDDLFELTAKELKQNGHGNFINMVRFHIKCKDATPAKAGINPFTKEPCVFKAKPESKTVKAIATKKLKDALKGFL